MLFSNGEFSRNTNSVSQKQLLKLLNVKKILTLQHPWTHKNTIHIQTDMLMQTLHVASSPFSWNFLKHGVIHNPTKHDEHWYLDRFCFVAVEQKRHLLKLDNLSGRCDPTSLNLISSGTPRGRPCFAYFFLMSCVFSCTWSSHAE